jgi:hypothetical protein
VNFTCELELRKTEGMVAATKDQPPTVEVGKVSALSLLKKRAEREGAGSDAEQKEDYMSYDLGRSVPGAVCCRPGRAAQFRQSLSFKGKC